MKVTAFNINICSEHPEKLVDFYANVVGLQRLPISPVLFMAGGAALFVDGHSEVKGESREPQRLLITFTVDDAIAEQKRLQAAGVTFVRRRRENHRVDSSQRSSTSTETTAS